MLLNPSKYPNYFELRKEIDSGRLSCQELSQYFLNRIKRGNPSINAFIETFDEDVIQQSKVVDRKIAEGKQGKLAGLIIGIKDNICIENKATSASSAILKGFKPPYNATVVDRLIAEDAIIIGRLNCDEFGMGSSNENSCYGAVRNPLDLDKVPGGSSGGSAAAVAAGLCMAALGTDTGGSIRQPASFCGLVGLKPTYGRVSRYGCIAYASSLDQIGILANSVEDCKQVLSVIAGHDKNDSTSVDEPINFNSEPKAWKVAFIEDSLTNDFVQSEVKDEMLKYIGILKHQGTCIAPEKLDIEYLPSVYYTITSAEAVTNLQRYSGIHFGYGFEGKTYEETVRVSRNNGFGKEPKKRILLGNYILTKRNSLYEKAKELRALVSSDLEKLFSTYDFLITPTTFETAFPLDSKSNDPEGQYFQDVFLVMANLTGIPSISLPLFQGYNNMPFGLNVMANRFKEKEIFAFSRQLMTDVGKF